MKMRSLYLLSVFVLVFHQGGNVNGNGGDSFKRKTLDRYGLPRMYEMDEYWNCGGQYCRVDVKVEPQDELSKMYKEIERSKADWKHRYNREYFHRSLCIPRNVSEKDLWKYARKTITEEFSPWNSTVELSDVRCLRPFEVTSLDILLYVITISALVIWFHSPTHNLFKRKRPDNSKSIRPEICEECKSNMIEKYIFSFPIVKKLERLNQQSKSPDYQRLKSIQGLRFFNTILMIIFHTKNSFNRVYIDEVPMWEEILSHPVVFFTLQAELLLVQVYFMISSFLLTNQILELYKRNGEFTISNVAIMLLNRIARLLPPLLAATVLSIPFPKIISGPQTFDSIQMLRDECVCSWWHTLFQMNFLLPFAKICMPTTWYISLDTLCYFSTLLLLYTKLKLNLDLKKLLAIFFVISGAIYGGVIYLGNLDILYKAYPQQFKDILHAPEFNTLYKGPFANWTTSFVGVAFGTIYFYTKTKTDKELGITMKSFIFWYLTFLTLPPVVVLLTTVDWTPGLQRALVGPLIRPLYAFAFGVGVLGMSRGYGGFVKGLLESRTILFLADYTYCTYVFHFMIVFAKGVLTQELIAVSFFSLICWMTVDVLASFGLGIVMTVLVEQPGLVLQKKYLPQVVKKPVNIVNGFKKE